MTGYGRLSDRMIVVAGGLAAWSDEEARHLSACADCAAEWRLVQRGRALGAGLPSPDLDRVVRGVRARLAAAEVTPIASRRRYGRWLGLMAAAAVVIVAVRFGSRRNEPVAAGGVLTELEELSSSELESVLTDLEVGGSADDGNLGDLDADELEQVLHSWES